MKSSRVVTLLLLPIFIVMLPSCTKHAPDKNFVTYVQADPGKLDPFYSTDVVSGKILSKLFNGLFTIDTNGKLVTDLAKEYAFNGTKLNIKLYNNIKLHNGDILTSSDVKYSIERIAFSSNPTSPRNWVFSNIKTIDMVSPSELNIELNKSEATFLYKLTMPCGYIISEKAFSMDKSLVGSGPFKIKEWLTDDRIVLEGFEEYFGGSPKLSGMTWKIIPENMTARFEFLNGTIDYFEMPLLASVNLKDKKYQLIKVPELNVHYLAFNNQSYPFTDKNFRKALNMAVNRPELIARLFNGKLSPASGPVPPSCGGYISQIRGYDYNPEEAKRIINELGLTGKEIVLQVKADQVLSQIAQLLQFYLNQTGLKVVIKSEEWSALKASVYQGKFDMAYFNWYGDYPEPENFLYPLFFSANKGSGGNRSFYNSPEVDKLLISASQCVDQGKRFDIYHQVEKRIVDDAPWLFLWYGNMQIALSERVKGYESYPVYNGLKGDKISLSE